MTIEIIHHFIGPKNHGGMAVLAQHHAGDSWIEIAVVPCSVADNYKKKVAVQLLRDSFQNLQTIRLPINPGLRNKVTHRVLRDIVLVAFAGHAMMHIEDRG